MEPNYSPTLFFIILFTAITAFAIIMAWLQRKDEDKAYRQGKRDAKKDTINNGLQDRARRYK